MDIYISDQKDIKNYKNIFNSEFPKFHVKYFTSNRELLEEAKREKIDVAIIDGDENNIMIVAKKLKELNDKINLIIVASKKAHLSEANELFVSGFMLKPIDKQGLKNQINHLRYPIS